MRRNTEALIAIDETEPSLLKEGRCLLNPAPRFDTVSAEYNKTAGEEGTGNIL